MKNKTVPLVKKPEGRVMRHIGCGRILYTGFVCERPTICFLYGLYMDIRCRTYKQYYYMAIICFFRGEQPMKTRDQIYAREARAILRDISMYQVLTEEQIQRLHSSKYVRGRERVRNLLTYLVKQQRACLSEGEQFYLASPDTLEDMDRGLFAAVWVLTDFMDQVEYHSVGDYLAKIIFFADGEVYEIVHAAQGKKVLVLSHL